MALQPTQHPADSGALNFNTVANNDTVNYGNGTNVVLLVKNGDTGSHVVSIDPAGNTAYGDALPVHQVTVPAGAIKAIPLRRDYDNGTQSNTATLTFDGVTSVTVAVLQVP